MNKNPEEQESPKTEEVSSGVRQSIDPPKGDDNKIHVYAHMAPTEIPKISEKIYHQWSVIRAGRKAMSWKYYHDLMKRVLCKREDPWTERKIKPRSCLSLPFPDIEPYRLLKVATEAFMAVNCAVFETEDKFDECIDKMGEKEVDKLLLEEKVRHDREVTRDFIKDYWTEYLKPVDDNGEGESLNVLPYFALIRKKLDGRITDEEGKICDAIMREKITKPCYLELIWNYWHEEGMLVQAMNAISMRFQNKKVSSASDPLGHLTIDPLRPLNNLLWGWIQDAQHRLSLVRRAYEYDHEYGLRLHGKAIPTMHTADRRTQFIEAFHNLLHRCYIFFKEDDDTTVIADGYPVLNGLKELHLILTQGAHNQYGDLPWTARQEFLMQQYILARPEMREFLPGRIMVDYPEYWMDRVDTMKRLQGWTDVSILNFNWLAQFGEQLLLSVRFGDWSQITNRYVAAYWARYWRNEIQGYINNYQVVTGVDLTSEPIDYTMPSVLLRKQLEKQKKIV